MNDVGTKNEGMIPNGARDAFAFFACFTVLPYNDLQRLATVADTPRFFLFRWFCLAAAAACMMHFFPVPAFAFFSDRVLFFSFF